MNNRQKRILTYMMLSVPLSFDYFYKLENEEVELIYYYGTSKTIKVPSRYSGSNITSLEEACFNSNQQVVEVTIQDRIEAIY